jgi:hypothetical protein
MSSQPDKPDRSDLPGRGIASSDEVRQLEQATAPKGRLTVAAADTEIIALRESWLALSHLLETNSPPVDEAALLLQVRRQVGGQMKRRRWQGAGLAMAASLLLAVSVAWLISRSSHAPVPDNRDAPIAESPKIQTPLEQTQYVAVEPATVGSADEFGDAYWQDDLADDLAQTRQDLVDVQTNWARLPDPVAWMQFQMNEFEHELGDSSL